MYTVFIFITWITPIHLILHAEFKNESDSYLRLHMSLNCKYMYAQFAMCCHNKYNIQYCLSLTEQN